MSYIDRIKLNAFETKIRENKNNSQNYVNNVNFNGQIFPFRENNSEYKYMSVTIDLTEEDPSKCCQYRDDALSMTAGSSDWDEFFGHFPCTLNESTKEVKKLNRDNFNKYEDNANRDNTFDTMICFPLRGINIFRVSHYLTVSMTDNPNDSAYQYYAHTYNGIIRKNMYISAYKARKTNWNSQFQDTDSIYSTYKNGNVTARLTQSYYFRTDGTDGSILANFKKACSNKGFGYDAYGWYQYIYLQVMYILKYCNLDSQKTIGRGLVNRNSATLYVGNTDTYGMDSELKRAEVGSDFTYCTEDYDYMSSLPAYQVKLFGLEDLWGNRWTLLDNIKAIDESKLYTSTTNGTPVNNSYYKNIIKVPRNLRGWLRIPYGTNELGFLADTISTIPNTSVNFTDENTITLDKDFIYMGQGGYYAELNSAGIFLNGLMLNDTGSSYTFRFCYFEN